MLDRYATRYGIPPDTIKKDENGRLIHNVYSHVSFNAIVLFLSKWKEEQEANDRYLELEKALNTPPRNVQGSG